MRIAISGCGTAGPAAGIFLKKMGHKVDLFERAPECKPVGAGFLLQPTGMVVLEKLGILGKVLEHVSKVDELHLIDPKGRDLMRLRYERLQPGLFGGGLSRPVLVHFLIQAAEEAGVKIHWNHEIVSAERHGKKWSLRDSEEHQFEGYDLLIVADGTRSRLRSLLSPNGIDVGYSWGAHWYIGENDGTFDETELFQISKGTSVLLGFLGTGRPLDSDRRLVSLFWSISLKQDAEIRSAPLDRWKEQILGVYPKAEGFLSQITDWDQIATARYGDVRMWPWHREGCVFLGDAAHAMSPQLGQGVNLALMDAECLADCMADDSRSLAEQLAQYSERRRVSLRFYSRATRWLTPWFQSDYEFLGPVRDVGLHIAKRIPFIQKEMTASMAGFKKGFVRPMRRSDVVMPKHLLS